MDMSTWKFYNLKTVDLISNEIEKCLYLKAMELRPEALLVTQNTRNKHIIIFIIIYYLNKMYTVNAKWSKNVAGN